MKNVFRFETLLKWRERLRDEAGAAVGQVVQAIEQLDRQRDQLISQQTESRAASVQNRVGEVSVDRLVSEGRYWLQLELQLKSLAETRVKLVDALHQRQQRLTEAEAEVKRFERLKEIDEASRKKEQQRREQLMLDELVTARYARNQQRTP